MAAGVPAGPVNSVPAAFAQAHAAHRDMLVADGDYRGVGPPVKLSGTPTLPPRRPPRFGEHAPEVLAAAGYTEEQIADLKRDAIVRTEAKQR